jgi:hypothetical protein
MPRKIFHEKIPKAFSYETAVFILQQLDEKGRRKVTGK